MLSLTRLVEREGKPFREMKAFTENESKVCGQVTILQPNPATYGDDVKLMLERRLTFADARRARGSDCRLEDTCCK